MPANTMTHHPEDFVKALEATENRNGIIDLTPLVDIPDHPADAAPPQAPLDNPADDPDAAGESTPPVDSAVEDPVEQASDWTPPTVRTRLLRVDERGMFVERPAKPAGSENLFTEPGRSLRGVIHYGHGRWAFTTAVVRAVRYRLNDQQTVPAVQLAEPQQPRNAQRRSFYRVSTVGAPLPPLQVWPLHDVESCIPAEQANQARHRDPDNPPPPTRMPELGPHFTADLLDISGGGLAFGLSLTFDALFDEHEHYWMQLDLPEVSAPLYVAGRVIRVHRDAARAYIQVGISFVFDHHPSHRQFIEQHICRYAAYEQRRKLKRHR
jgi:hypothetical protein